MAFKKTIANTDAQVVIVGGKSENKYPVGFTYLLDKIKFEVTDKFFSDNTEWRRVQGSDGSTSDLTVATIDEDLQASNATVKTGQVKPYAPPKDAVVIEKDEPVVEEVQEEVKAKKSSGKKVAKKKK